VRFEKSSKNCYIVHGLLLANVHVTLILIYRNIYYCAEMWAASLFVSWNVPNSPTSWNNNVHFPDNKSAVLGPYSHLSHENSFIITKTTNKVQLCRLIYYSLSSLHVSGDVSAQHQEHLTVFTASGNIHQCRWMSWKGVPTHPWHQPAMTLVNITRCCK